MSLKEFADRGGVIILDRPTDLQDAVEMARSLGFPVSRQYTAVGRYPFFLSLGDGRLLTQEEAKDRPNSMGIDDLRGQHDLIKGQIKENVDDETVYVQCTKVDEYRECLKYFRTQTGQSRKEQELVDTAPFFNLQNGFLYPAYCLSRPARIISFKEFNRTFVETKKEETSIDDDLKEIISAANTVTMAVKRVMNKLRDGNVR